MSRSSDHPAYVGRIAWSYRNKRWDITVCDERGSAVVVEGVFLAAALANRLESAGATAPQATLVTAHCACVVSMLGPVGTQKQSRLLLAVLKKFYPMHKGVSIDWAAG